VSQRSKDLTEERVILFLKMAPGSEFSQDLVKRVKTNIRNQLSARHVPGIILETHDIPVSNCHNDCIIFPFAMMSRTFKNPPIWAHFM